MPAAPCAGRGRPFIGGAVPLLGRCGRCCGRSCSCSRPCGPPERRWSPPSEFCCWRWSRSFRLRGGPRCCGCGGGRSVGRLASAGGSSACTINLNARLVGGGCLCALHQRLGWRHACRHGITPGAAKHEMCIAEGLRFRKPSCCSTYHCKSTYQLHSVSLRSTVPSLGKGRLVLTDPTSAL